MTGTARAALRLALGLLRRSVDDPPECCDIATIGEVADVIAMMEQSWDGPLSSALHGAQRYGRDWRIIRARLALYLRAVLRAEAGAVDHALPEAGAWTVDTYPADRWLGYVCRSIRWDEEFAATSWPTSDRYERVRLAVPLWSQAPGRKT